MGVDIQLCLLGFSLLQDRDVGVGVGVFPSTRKSL
jgi:hypothetical protein